MNNSDNTKLLKLSAASIATGTLRTVTAPDANGTWGLLEVQQTWSNINTFTDHVNLYQSVANGRGARFFNSNTTGYSGADYTDASGNVKGFVSFANSGAAVDFSTFIVGTPDATDFDILTNNTRRLKFVGSGGAVWSATQTFSADAAYDIGTSGVKPATIYSHVVNFGTWQVPSGNAQVAASVFPSANITFGLGDPSNRWAGIYANGLDVLAGIQLGSLAGIGAPNGAAGISSILSCGGGQAIKTLTVSSGIVTAATCGAP